MLLFSLFYNYQLRFLLLREREFQVKVKYLQFGLRSSCHHDMTKQFPFVVVLYNVFMAGLVGWLLKMLGLFFF